MDNKFTFDWFRHDKDMRNDPKIKILRKKYPAWGYTIWVMLLETLCDCPNGQYKWNELSPCLLAADFDCEEDILNMVLETMLSLNLVQFEEFDGIKFLTSQKFVERTKEMALKKEHLKAAGIASGAARRAKSNKCSTNVQECSTDVQQMLNNAEQMLNTNEKRKKESNKENKDKETRIEENRKEKNCYYYSFEKQKQEDFFISFFFFERKFSSPEAEYNAMVQWNNAPGHISWAKLTFEQKCSCAFQWRSKEQKEAEKSKTTPPARFGDRFYNLWKSIGSSLVNLNAPDEVIRGLVSDSVRYELSKSTSGVVFYLPQVSVDYLKENWKAVCDEAVKVTITDLMNQLSVNKFNMIYSK